MGTLAVEKSVAAGLTQAITSYDPTKWNLLPTNAHGLLQKRSDLGTPFIGPMVAPVFRPFESAVAIGGNFIQAFSWSPLIDWVFWGDVAAAGATRRIMFVEFHRDTASWGTTGYITLTPPPGGTNTIRGYRMTLDRYITGQAACAGGTVNVTGSATAWLASGLAVGSRIGFGSTDATQISTWYEIAGISADGALTLTGNGPNTGGNVAYVIEELRCVMACTNGTTTSGGLFLAKGLRIELFSAGGTTINAAVSTDNQRATYWLADASTVTNTVACGCAINGGPVNGRDSWTQHFVYVMDTLTPTRIFKYNIRAALSGLASGKSTSAWVYTTGTQAVTGTNHQINNGRMASAGHGPGSGVNSFYFNTTTRFYRVAEGNITSGNSSFISDAMVEIPPGSVATFAATAALAGVEYADSIDRFMLMSTGASGARSYITQYRTDSGQIDHIFLVDDKQIDQSTKDSDAPDHPSIIVGAVTVQTNDGLLYILHPGTTAPTSFIHVVPIGAHWTYAATAPIQRLIAPKMDTIGAQSFGRATWLAPEYIGGATNDALGISTDPIRAYYRISGITDNSGAWTPVPADGGMSAVGAADAIQLMFEFRCITQVSIPGRIYSALVTYDDGSINDPHYRQSIRWSDRTAKQFAFRFCSAFGSTVPALRIRIYDDVTGSQVLDDNTSAPTGTWEKSTNDGGAWVAWTNADKGNETTFLRYTPSTLADNFKARARLTLL